MEFDIKIEELEIGQEYVLTHKHKGICRGTYMGFVPAYPNDECDTKFLYFHFDTSRGSGQERLARAANVEMTDVNIRPSLLENIRASTRSPKLPPTPPPPEPEPRQLTRFERIKRRFKK